MFFLDAEGRQHSLPVSWTDAAGPDVFVTMAAGRTSAAELCSRSAAATSPNNEVTNTTAVDLGTRTPALATCVPAPDSCQLLVRAGSVKVVFACTCTGQLDGRGCPAVTDGLDGFCPAPDNSDSGSRDTLPALMRLAVC